MDFLPGDKLLSSVQRRAAAALGESGYRHARATALALPPPPGAARASLRRRLRAAPALWRLRRQTRRAMATLAAVQARNLLPISARAHHELVEVSP